MESNYIAVNGVRLHVGDWGGTGPTILFGHPTGFLGGIWRPVIEGLRNRGSTAKILTYDQRGHGLSSKPDTGYEWNNLVADLVQLADALDLEDVIGVGHSAGATTLAAATAERPGLARRLVLIDPILYSAQTTPGRKRGASRMAAKTRTRRLVWASRDELFESYRARSPYDTWTEAALRNYIDAGTFERPDGEYELFCPGRIEAQIYEHADDFDAYAALALLTVPTLLVRGARSDSFDADRANRALDALEFGRMLTLENASHYIPMEEPATVCDLILAEFDAGRYTGRA